MNKIKFSKILNIHSKRMDKKGLSVAERIIVALLIVGVVFMVLNFSGIGLDSIKSAFGNFIPDKISVNQESKDLKVNEALPLIKYGLLDNSLTYRQNGEWKTYKNDILNSQISGDFGSWHASFIDYWYEGRKESLPQKISLKSGKNAFISSFPVETLKSSDGKILLRSYVVIDFVDAPEKLYGVYGFRKPYYNSYLLSYDKKLYRQKKDDTKVLDSYEFIINPSGDEKEIIQFTNDWRESIRNKPINLEILRNGVSESSYFCTVNYSGNSLTVDLSKPVSSDKECI